MSKVIPGLASNGWQRWDAPNMAVDRRSLDGKLAEKLPTEQELEQLRLCAYEEGFAAGRGDGLARSRQEIDAQVQQLKSLIEALARPFQSLDRQVENELVALVTALVRQLVRREIRTDPGVVVAAVREALGVLPVGARNVNVQLHPTDAALVRELLSGQEQEWRISENPGLTRGGCLVVTDTSRVDATVERRLGEAVLKVFGGERHADPQLPSGKATASNTDPYGNAAVSSSDIGTPGEGG
ncbi:MAG: flagellar assembly protein FliH [Chromatiaceae bacterium]